MNDHYYKLKTISKANGGKPGSIHEGKLCGAGGAGTIFFKDHNYLDIDNKGIETSQMTKVTSQGRGHSSGKNSVSDNLVVIDGAQVLIEDYNGVKNYEMIIPYFYMVGKSGVTFEI